jgi:hypothetical protein
LLSSLRRVRLPVNSFFLPPQHLSPEKNIERCNGKTILDLVPKTFSMAEKTSSEGVGRDRACSSYDIENGF